MSNQTDITVRRRQIAAGEARSAVFTRIYDAPIEDVWDACTNPKRLARWYASVEGDLEVGGTFTQGGFGSGKILRCSSPHLLTIELCDGADELELSLRTLDDGRTEFTLEHATTLDQHEIGGQMFDAVYCMGGGYGPRLVTLEQHLSGTLPEEIDANQLHTYPQYRGPIEESMSTLESLIPTL